MSALPVTLEDKYTLASGRIFLTGTQALVRLAMVQRERDLAAGLNTAGFISGYRGSPLGGFDQALWKARDDHACKSSTLPHQSEHAFDAAMIPVLYPTGVQEIIELGLHGIAMSRYSGCYVAFKVVSETVDSSASINLDLDNPRIVLPEDFA